MCGLSGSVNTTRFLVHSSDQARGGLETRLCILFASNPACCQDYAICNFLRLLQPFQSLVVSSCSWSIGRVYCFRQPSRSRLGPTKTQCWLKQKICAPWISFSRAKGRVQQNWRREELSVLDGCVLWGERVVVPPSGRE